jgi:hypothetical protein
MLASKAQNGFVAVENCFVVVSSGCEPWQRELPSLRTPGAR